VAGEDPGGKGAALSRHARQGDGVSVVEAERQVALSNSLAAALGPQPAGPLYPDKCVVRKRVGLLHGNNARARADAQRALFLQQRHRIGSVERRGGAPRLHPWVSKGERKLRCSPKNTYVYIFVANIAIICVFMHI